MKNVDGEHDVEDAPSILAQDMKPLGKYSGKREGVRDTLGYWGGGRMLCLAAHLEAE